jgi:protoheme IX farnesyltransferase
VAALAPYFQLTKPRLLPLVLLSGLPALVMAAGGWPAPAQAAAILGGIALAAGAANALNSYLERDKDALMTRTAGRPLPAGALDPRGALAFGLALCVAGPGLLWYTSGLPAAAVAVAAILFYVFVYTLWLKPRTPAAVVWGGIAGAVSPLIADAAIGGSIGAAGWIVFAIVFAWQPPHFWAITIYRRPEYEAAGFPLLVTRIGEAATARRIVAWIAGLVAVTLLPVPLGMLGPLYALGAIALGAYFLSAGVRVLRDPSAESARHVFRVSLVYLMGLFAVMLADLLARALLS